MTKEEIIKPNSPRQIVGKIKKQAESKIWSKDSKDWYVAEIDDWVEYKLATQKKDLLKKIDGAKNQFKDGYYAFHFTYTSNTGKRIAEINRVNERLPPDMAYQLAKKHISEFPESVMDWFVENRGIIHILEDIKQSLK